MKLQWIPQLVVIIVNLVFDLWLFKKLRKGQGARRRAAGAHLLLSLLLLAAIVMVMAVRRDRCDNATLVAVMWALYAYYAFYAPRYLALPFYALTHFKKMGRRTRRVGTALATVVGVSAFGVMLWGAFVTPSHLKVEHVTLEFSNLPPEFDGYRIAQFSDTHLGTYNGRTEFVEQYVDSINALHPDLICFTGDLVNRKTDEAVPYVNILSRLKAPDGVLSVLGNHDDDFYMSWDSEQAKQRDRDALIALERKMGWKVLINEHVLLTRDTAQIAVVGTKSFLLWPFPRKASLDTAYADYATSKRFSILLQHNPRQWNLDIFVQNKSVDFNLRDSVDLMLSGHTHAMQCMVEIMGKKFSPARLHNRYWEGLYRHGEHKLYVNIGVGMVGIPARLGSAYPTITLITLRRKPPGK